MARPRKISALIAATVAGTVLVASSAPSRADTITFDLANTSTISISDPAPFMGAAVSGRLILNTPSFSAIAGAAISVNPISLDFGSAQSFPLTTRRDSPLLGTLNVALTSVALQSLPQAGSAFLRFTNLATPGAAGVNLFVRSQASSIVVTLNIVGREIARAVQPVPEPASTGMLALGLAIALGLGAAARRSANGLPRR